MNCLVCDRDGVSTPAVAVCPSCNAGLCPTHLEETARIWDPEDTDQSCEHDTWETPEQLTG